MTCKNMDKEETQEEFKITVLGVIFDPRTRKILIGKRKADASAPNLRWCFVGGRLSSDEELDKTLKRKIKERTGLQVKNLGAIFADNCTIKDKLLLLYFLCEAVEGEEKTGEKIEELKWIKPTEIENYFEIPIHKRLKEYLINLG